MPLGTFNLLAKSLEYPSSIEAIFEIIKNNKTKQIDVVEINNKIVVNHAWIGFYYYILKERKKHKDILGKNKLKKTIFNTIFLFKKMPIYQLSFNANGVHFSYPSCLVFMSNKVIVMHHNLIHSVRHEIINDSENIIDIFSNIGINLVLSGHIHQPLVELLKHKREKNLYVVTAETAISTRTIQPNSFDVLEVDEEKFALIVESFNGNQFIAGTKSIYTF